MSITTYIPKELRKDLKIKFEEDLDFDVLQEGETICSVENDSCHKIRLRPQVIQINRLLQRDTSGEPIYDIKADVKAKTIDI